MKQFIAHVQELEPVQNEQYPALNDGYNVKKSYYAVIPENQPLDDELIRTEFKMWTEGLSDLQVTNILNVLNNYSVS